MPGIEGSSFSRSFGLTREDRPTHQEDVENNLRNLQRVANGEIPEEQLFQDAPSEQPDILEEPAVELRTNLDSDSDHAKLLDKIDRLRELGVNRYLSLPQLVCVGDQSAGKSSVIEGVTGLPLPRAAGLCTRFATQIILRHNTTLRDVSISIKPFPGDDSRTRAEKEELASFARKIPESELKSSVIENIFEDASRIMKVPYSVNRASSTPATKSFSKDLLCIEMSGPKHPGLTILDLPGLIKTATKHQSNSDIKLIEDITLNYLKDKNTIIVAVLAANIDIANQVILEHAIEHDPQGKRTLGVITKPDLVGPGDEPEVIQTAKGLTKPLGLGYFVLRNRPTLDTMQRTSIQSRDRAEDKFFENAPWSSLSKDRVGVHKLKKFLQACLNNLIRNELPGLHAELESKIDICKSRIDSMGEPRESESSRRTYLTHIIMKASFLAEQAFDGRYQDRDFSRYPDLKLRMQSRALSKRLASDFIIYGNSRPFGKLSPTDKSTHGEEGSGGTFFEDGRFEPYVYDRDDFSLPDRDTYEWIEKVYRESQGVELPTSTNSQAMPPLFQEMTKSWPALCNYYLNEAGGLVRSFHKILLDVSCPDVHVRERLNSVLSDELTMAFALAKRDLDELLVDERSSWLFTENSDLERMTRKFKKLRLSESLQNVALAGVTVERIQENLQYFRQDVAQHVINNEVNSLVYELHDQLRAYYYIARRRMVDNMVIQILERRIYRPLSEIYAPSWIAGLNSEQLCALASEESDMVKLRGELKTEYESLTHARNTLL